MSEVNEAENILQTTQDFLASMPFQSICQCMSLLKSLDGVPYHADNAGIIQQCVGLISYKASLWSNISTPTSFSPESVHSSNSSDTHSYACFYEDITHLSVQMLEKLVTAMISHHVDNKFLAKCLLRYLQSAKKRALSKDGRNTWSATEMVTLETFERVVSLLHKLERGCMSCRSLFGLQRMATKLHGSKACRKKIEEMIGFQLDKATLDNILVSRRHHDGSVYDVNLILRLVKTFLLRTEADAHSVLDIGPLKRVGNLLDKYLAEIAPDPGLTGAKFKAVADSLPEFARDSHDDLYRALDIYLEAHPRVQEEEATELCKAINFNKLSIETSMHVAQSLRFPARVTLQVLLKEQANLKAAMRHHQHGNARKTGDVSALSLSTSSSFLKRQGSNVGYNQAPHQEQHENNMIKIQTSNVGYKQSLDYRHENSVVNTQLNSPSTIAGNSTRSKSSKSSLTWDGSLHSHSNGSSRRSLYDQMTLDFAVVGEQELEYQLVLQQNEELRADLHVMQSRVLELEKACGQMRSKVTKYMNTKHLLC